MSTIADQTMRAISPTGWGGAELLAEIRTPRPAPSPTEVLVRVHAAGVNATDWKQRVTGGFGLWGDPPILGYDVSGTVEAVGLGVALFAPADAARRGIRVAAPLVEPDRLALTEIAALVKRGALRPVIDTVLPLARARQAHELGESGRTTGKIVLTLG